MALIEVKVPDIGDFDEVAVIELLVKVGDTMMAEKSPRDLKNATIEQFIEAVDSYIRWHNEKRIKISLGSLSPIEYRVSLGLAA